MKLLFTHLLFVGIILIAGVTVAATGLSEYPEPSGEKCVEPTDIMRREHMNFILHQRDETMYKGIRGGAAKHSLKGCIDCHVAYNHQGKAIPVNDQGQFCQSCHHYVAVNIDCFSCHRAIPDAQNKVHLKPVTGSRVSNRNEH